MSEPAAPAFSRWPAPAKINLFLHVLGRRADGYHELQTCFQFLDRADQIDLRVREDGRIERLGGLDIPAESDLAVRAARLLQQATGVALGADILVHKNVPHGAGLGGGSSDAATVLCGLNDLWKAGLTEPALQRLGLKLGADVPVFVAGRAAFAEGVGERLTPLAGKEQPIEHNYLILKPNCSVSTAEIFTAPELTRNSPPITIRGFLETGGRNDCTATVRGRFPPVARALDWLSQFGEARLTGTGACVFLPLASLPQGEDILERLPPEWSGFIARGLNESPLRARLQARRDGRE
jgi:4-diphosphocytidyl-2-C-methyl-D-erythritol kinase